MPIPRGTSRIQRLEESPTVTASFMEPARLIVCEQRGVWASALRRSRRRAACRVYEARSLAAVRPQLDDSPHSVLVWELTRGNVRKLLDQLPSLRAEFPQGCVIVVGERRLAAWEWVVREAGAAHATFSRRRLDLVWRMVERQLDRAPPPRLNWQEQLWRRLPWPSATH